MGRAALERGQALAPGAEVVVRTWPLVLLSLSLGSIAQAGPLCDALLQPRPRVSAVRAALESGDDVDAACAWTEDKRLIETAGGVVLAVVLPPIGLLLGFSEDVHQRREAVPIVLAAGEGDPALVQVLLAHHPSLEGLPLVDLAVDADSVESARQLIEAGADPELAVLSEPLAGDRARLERFLAAGVRLDEVHGLFSAGALVRDPATLEAFLEAGLPAPLTLELAVDEGDARVVGRVLDHLGEGPEAEAALQGALVRALERRRWAVAEQLVAAGAPVDPAPGSEGALHEAAGAGEVESLRWLLDHGASLEVHDDAGRTPLFDAALLGRTEALDLLLEAGARVEARDASGDTPLVVAVRGGEASAVRTLLAAGADPAGAELGAAQESLSSCRPDLLALLLEAGLPAGARDSRGQPLVVLAAEEDCLPGVQALVAAGASLSGGSTATSALHAAIASGDTALVRAVVALGADPRALPEPELAWEEASRASLAMEDLLLELGVRPGPQAVREAAEDGEVERVRRLLAAGAPVDGVDAFDHTALYALVDHAPEPWHPELLEVLLAAGASPDVADAFGRTPLTVAVERRREAVARRLVEAGGSLEVRDHMGQTPLVAAVSHRDEEAVRLLLSLGASPETPDDGGLTPLWHAADRGHATLVQILVDAGARADVANRFGETPLHAAVEAGRAELVPLLRRAHGDPLAEDHVGRSPVDIAAGRGDERSLAALVEGLDPVPPEALRAWASWCAVDALKQSRARWPAPVDERSLLRAGKQGGCRAEIKALLR